MSINRLFSVQQTLSLVCLFAFAEINAEPSSSEEATILLQANQSAPSQITSAPREVQSPLSKNPGYNAAARTDVAREWDFWIDGSFVLWQPKMDNFIFALNMTPSPTTDNQYLPVDGDIVYMNSPFKPGFKIGVGMNFPSDDWSLGTEYTYLQASNQQQLSVPLGRVLRTFWNNAVNSGDPIQEDTSWRYFFNIVDLSLSRAGYFGRQLTLTPHLGARLFINDQTLIAHTVFNTSLYPGFTAFRTKTQIQANGWELGPRGGLGANWLLGYGLELLSDVAVSVLYADFNSTYTELGNTQTSNATQRAINVVDHAQYFCPNLDISVGFGWKRYLDSNNYCIALAAQYDFLYFWNNNQLSKQVARDLAFPRDDTAPSLTLNGLTLNARFDF